MVQFFKERKITDKKVSVNQESRTIQYQVCRVTIVNDSLRMEKAEKLLNQARERNYTFYSELSQTYVTTLEQKTTIDLEVSDAFIKELPADFVGKIGLQILKGYRLTKEVTNITVKSK